MPGLTPGRRWQPPYFPFKKEPFGRRMLARIERWVKGPLFGCRMCGNCLLQETAFICPMACPKGLRNGPCGGSTSENCYLDETYPCTWYMIFDRAFKMGREELLLEVLPPLDWDQVGTETWGQVYHQVRKVGVRTFVGGMLSGDSVRRELVWDAVFRPVRQPEWWAGDAEYHPPAYDQPASELERRLQDGEFVIATEISPPASIATGKLRREIDLLKPYVAAINFTDGASATPRMSSIACSQVAMEMGAEPVLQIAARDNTRTSLQSTVIGASALGVRNILCVSGDSARVGPSPMARIDQLDIDSVQMLWILRKLRDEGRYLDGREIKKPPRYFLGAAASPFASEVRFQALREQKKFNAGAQFFQTNLVFDADRLDDWLDELAQRGILGKVYILIGITPLRSARMAEYLHDQVPGVRLPERVLKRMQQAGDGAEEEGVQIALETIEALKEKGCINGIHLMPVGWEPIVPRLLEETGLGDGDFLARLQDCVQA
jgi:methylenetetrahydrofolate reductase (NADPH)